VSNDKACFIGYDRASGPHTICPVESLQDSGAMVMLPSAEEWPALGIGTARMGESAAQAAQEVAALRAALDIGYRVIDTAELYGQGGAETLLGRALREAMADGLRREDLCIVSKVLPERAHPAAMLEACEQSLQRLGLDCIDLYLLHWRGSVPLKDTVDGFEILQQRHWIRHWGVSNFSIDDMRELVAVPGGAACSVNQVWYSLNQRGPELDLLPWMRLYEMPLMAYCPLDEGALLAHTGLQRLAQRKGTSASSLALAWLLAQGNVLPIPKASHAAHLKENWASQQQRLSAEDLAELDALFPPPRTRQPLATR
jgi:diketogulonate reductase-like aldo/keto reductase